MTDVDGGELEAAIRAAEETLAIAQPGEPRRNIASKVTLAVLPEILTLVEGNVAALRVSYSEAQAALAVAREQIDQVAASARAQSERLRMVVEEINYVAMAQQIIGGFTAAGETITAREQMLIEATTAQAIRRTVQSFGFAISSDVERFLDP